MSRLRVFAVLTALLAGGPALAQDDGKLAMLLPSLSQDDATTQMTAGYAACLKDFGNAEAIAGSFTSNGWTRRDDTEAQIIQLEPEMGEKTAAALAVDGSYCHVESFSLTTGQAGHVLAMTLQLVGLQGAQVGADAQGCMTFTLANGIVATLTSGGQDPVCASQTSSAVRFSKVPQE